MARGVRITLRVGITGSRKFQWSNRIINKLQSLHTTIGNLHILVGDAQGVDRITREYCEVQSISYDVYFPEDHNDPQSYYLRNLRLVNDSETLIAFWNGKSRGTRVTIQIASILNKPLELVMV